MSDNAESGIAATQAKAARTDGLQKHHRSTIDYLNDRVFTYVFALCFVGLLVIWMISSSPYITYGSLLMAILLSLLWGVFRIKQIKQTRESRRQQAADWQSRQ